MTKLAKLQLVCALFPKTVADDLFFARQVAESIEAAADGAAADNLEAFIEGASRLAKALDQEAPLAQVGLVRAAEAGRPLSLLELRARLLEAVKVTCPFPRPLLVLTGLRAAICPEGRRWTKRKASEYEEIVAYCRQFLTSRSRPSSRLSLLIT